jgi:hypothetical protein
MKYFYLIIFSLTIHSISFTQQDGELNDIARYIIIRSISDYGKDDLYSFDFLERDLKYIEIYSDPNILSEYDFEIIPIDTILNYKLYSIQLFDQYHFFVKTFDQFIEIDTENILEFINNYLFKELQYIKKERLIDLYNLISFYGKDVYYYEYNSLYNSAKPILLNNLNKYGEVYSMNKLIEIKNELHIETYSLSYIFHWNRMEVNKYLEKKVLK